MITCFDIGGSAIKAATATAPDRLTHLGRVATPLDDFDAFAAVIANQVAAGDAPEGAAVSISVTGVIDPDTGVATVANIPCIDGRTLASDLSARLSRPVLVANDADCFVLAEAYAGAGQGQRVVFGAILGTGVGGALVADGKLHRGAGGWSGEWGHGTAVATEVSVPPYHLAHFPCGCGRSGCVDTIGGARGLERLHRTLHGTERSSLDIIQSWNSGDAAAAETVDLYVELVAQPLALVVNIIGPDIIPIGGGLSNSAELIGRLDEAVRAQILRKTDRSLLVPAKLTADAGLVGAASLAFSQGQ
ncbi:MAG TPA: ROK family protein [Devosia sp.]|jgi:N-acetylglucosamine kinase|uniref:ROK family protein n=1 Tax=Devosia sp. TaxID=1871048 RepID=UPI002F93C4FD